MGAGDWLGPTYVFTADGWTLSAGLPADGGRLEWLLRRDGLEEDGRSFMLPPQATRAELADALGELPDEVASALVEQVCAQLDPPLLSSEKGHEGLA